MRSGRSSHGTRPGRTLELRPKPNVGSRSRARGMPCRSATTECAASGASLPPRNIDMYMGSQWMVIMPEFANYLFSDRHPRRNTARMGGTPWSPTRIFRHCRGRTRRSATNTTTGTFFTCSLISGKHCRRKGATPRSACSRILTTAAGRPRSTPLISCLFLSSATTSSPQV